MKDPNEDFVTNSSTLVFEVNQEIVSRMIRENQTQQLLINIQITRVDNSISLHICITHNRNNELMFQKLPMSVQFSDVIKITRSI